MDQEVQTKAETPLQSWRQRLATKPQAVAEIVIQSRHPLDSLTDKGLFRQQAINPEFHDRLGGSRVAAKQAGSWKSGLSGLPCAIAQ